MCDLRLPRAARKNPRKGGNEESQEYPRTGSMKKKNLSISKRRISLLFNSGSPFSFYFYTLSKTKPLLLHELESGLERIISPTSNN